MFADLYEVTVILVVQYLAILFYTPTVGLLGVFIFAVGKLVRLLYLIWGLVC